MEKCIKKIRKQFIIVKSLVINEKGEVLFVRRKIGEIKQANNKWEFPGGKIDFGELPEQTAIREAKEESGYDVKIKYILPKLISSKWVSPEREAQQILVCYVCNLLGGKSTIPNHGVSEIKWFSIDKAPKNEDCLPGTIDFLNFYKESTQKKR